jgi:hypothetical protein
MLAFPVREAHSFDNPLEQWVYKNEKEQSDKRPLSPVEQILVMSLRLLPVPGDPQPDPPYRDQDDLSHEWDHEAPSNAAHAAPSGGCFFMAPLFFMGHFRLLYSVRVVVVYWRGYFRLRMVSVVMWFYRASV